MARRIEIHPTHPQVRLLRAAVEVLREDGVIVYPTDSTYALGCRMGAKDGQARIHAIRRDDVHHYLTLVCPDLSSLATHARVDNRAFRLLKSLTPGPYTFILQASRDIPKRILDPKRKTIGLRIPDHPVAQALLAEFGEPLLSATLTDPRLELPLPDPQDLFERYAHAIDLMLDAGACGLEATTILDLTGPRPVLVREGCGDVSRVLDLDAG